MFSCNDIKEKEYEIFKITLKTIDLILMENINKQYKNKLNCLENEIETFKKIFKIVKDQLSPFSSDPNFVSYIGKIFSTTHSSPEITAQMLIQGCLGDAKEALIKITSSYEFYKNEYEQIMTLNSYSHIMKKYHDLESMYVSFENYFKSSFPSTIDLFNDSISSMIHVINNYYENCFNFSNNNLEKIISFDTINQEIEDEIISKYING